jgi:hypothetical protein
MMNDEMGEKIDFPSLISHLPFVGRGWVFDQRGRFDDK